MTDEYIVRVAKPDEHTGIGKLMVSVYSQLEGFPKPAEQLSYYEMLMNIGVFTQKPGAALLVAVTATGIIHGAVVYFGDMTYYGSGGTATTEQNAAGFRLLAVSAEARGKGIGRLLVNECIEKAKKQAAQEMIIHSTKAMQTAWSMYEKMGFRRSADLDFMQGTLPVYGFRLFL